MMLMPMCRDSSTSPSHISVRWMCVALKLAHFVKLLSVAGAIKTSAYTKYFVINASVKFLVVF